MTRMHTLPATLILLTALSAAACLADSWPESEHPYLSNSDITWTWAMDTPADYMKLVFSQDSMLEANWDYLYLTDAEGTEQRLTGELGGRAVYLKGSEVTLRLTSDGSNELYGFSFDEISPATRAEYDLPRYTVSGGVITSFTGVVDDLVVPAVIDGQTVTGIGSNAFSKAACKTITLPDTVTDIGYRAFGDCPELTGVTLPAGLTAIGYSAFINCKKLCDITLPQGLSRIDPSAFEGCAGLTQITVPRGVTTIESRVFYGCTSLKKAVLTAPDVSLSYSAFFNDAQLTQLEATILSIGVYALEGCTALKSVELSENADSLPDINDLPAGTVLRLHEGTPLTDEVLYSGLTYVIIETGQTNQLSGSAKTVKEKVRQVVAAVVRPGMSDYQKALVLHNWLIKNATYDNTLTNYGADGVLLKGTGVCQSYAEGYKALLDEVGIESTFEHGTNHVWNMIRLDGEWYHVDCTWDDPGNGGYEEWSYFCVTNFALTGIRSHECTDRPHIATSYRYYYNYLSGRLDDWLAEVTGAIQAAVDGGSGAFTLEPILFTGHRGASAGGIAERMSLQIIRDNFTFTHNGQTVPLEIDMDPVTLAYSARVAHSDGACLTLPAALSSVSAEAFSGIAASRVIIPDGVTAIESRAFADCTRLTDITIPVSVTDIAADAFSGMQDLYIFGAAGSAAETWAKAHGYLFIEEE